VTSGVFSRRTVASLLRGVTEHCLARIQSLCPDKVDDIQAVRQSLTVLVNFCFMRINEKDIRLQETLTLTISFFENLEWYSRSGEMSLFDKLISGVCLLHPVFLSASLYFSKRGAY